MALIDGTENGEFLVGTAGSDTINGYGGFDTLEADAGNDLLNGGEGNDQLRGGGGSDTLIGGLGVDYFQMANVFDAGWQASDVDRITDLQAGEKIAVFTVLSGPILTGDDPSGLLSGRVMLGTPSAGVTRLYVGTNATPGADVVVDLVGNFTADQFYLDPSQFFEITFDPSSTIPVELVGTPAADSLTGANANDTLSGLDGADLLIGLGGNDSLDGGSGDDRLRGDGGNDTMFGGAGNDLMFGGAENDLLSGGAGADVLYGQGGDDTLTGGTGLDEFQFETTNVDYSPADIDRILDLELGDSLAFNVGSLSTVILTGDSPQQLSAGQVMVGATVSGVTRVYVGVDGGAGADITIDLVGSFSASSFGVNSGRSNQLVYDPNFNVPKLLIGTMGNDSLFGANVDDTIFGADGSDQLLGRSGFDQLFGGTGNDTLDGDAGNDFLEGGDGNDSLLGGSGGDRLIGGAGSDVLAGDAGNDTLTGGSWQDLFVLTAINGTAGDIDTITDLQTSDVLRFDFVGPLSSVIAQGNDPSGLLQGQVMVGATVNGVTRLFVGANSVAGAEIVVDLVGSYSASQFTVDALEPWKLICGPSLVPLNLTGTSSDDNLIGGSVNDTIVGGAGQDLLVGLDGNDFIDGGIAPDLMVGGGGNDFYIVDDAGDVVTEAALGGTDTVNADINYTLGAEVENLLLISTVAINGTGNGANNIITGNGAANLLSGLIGADTLTGAAGNDTLDGGTGADRMLGGVGDDVYIVDDAGDLVLEASVSGTDTVQSSLTHTLAFSVENLILTGAAAINGTGNGGANTITGNSANNVLAGSDGSDTIFGGAGNDTLVGGAGFDQLSGGAGDDLYLIVSFAQNVIEALGEGVDTINSNVGYTLTANVENLALTGAAIASGTGNDLGNLMTGNAAANTLSGLGGNDTLNGGAGNDTLNGGVGNNSLNGGADNDVLTASFGNDTLDGGTGADAMSGGAGNDLYVVDDAGDVVTEGAGGGTDTVNARVSHTLAINVENLNLTGAGVQDGTGNASANAIVGNSFANALSGLAGNDTLSAAAGNDTLSGGVGNDSLTGGAGNDMFVFDATLNAATNLDLIADFTSGADKMGLGSAIFTGLSAGDLATSAFFVAGTAAADANDRIIYNQVTGALFYDADGTGATAAIQFATLGATTHPTIAFTDFLLI
jgi:Ca2+-binding RTX toxin-like protein